MYKTKIKVHFHTWAWREGGREVDQKTLVYFQQKSCSVYYLTFLVYSFNSCPCMITTYTCIASLHCTQLFFFDFFLCCESVNVKVYKTAMMMLMRISTNISNVFAIIPSTLDILFWQISTFRKVRAAFVFGLPIL